MAETTAARPPLNELIRTFGGIGLVNFGGPAGQIALMHRTLVQQKGWIGDESYLRALNFCTLLPGPEAMQLATYVGWKLRGVAGGLIAGLLFVLPGSLVVLALSVLYAYAAHLGWVAAAFLGVKAAVLGIVTQALLRLSRRALNTPIKLLIAALAFVALFAAHAPFPLVIAAAGVAGWAVAKRSPRMLGLKAAEGEAHAPAPVALMATLRTALLWTAVWFAPMLAIFVLLGPDHVLFRLGLFFAKLALVTFGGAYALLAYMAQEVVTHFGWLKPGEMVDGLGLAETTPGPLILVTEFVGFMAAFRTPAPFLPLIAGLLGAGLTVWMTFAPCFLWIFVGAPFVERLERSTEVQGALSAITAAVVGVIANLTVWFGLHVLFRRFATVQAGAFGLAYPDVQTLDWRAAGLTAVAAVLLFRVRLGIAPVLAIAVLLGIGLHLLAPGST